MKLKYILLAIVIFFSSYSYSQEIPKLKLSPIGVEPIIVLVDSIKASELYTKSLKWVSETYKNPEKVLKAKLENEKIRIDGYAQNAWWYTSMGVKQSYNMEYSIEISFKDGKYRFEFIIGQFYIDNGQKAMFNYGSFYKKTGELKSSYSDAVPSLEETMNSLSFSFYNYVTGKNSKKDDNW